MHNIVARPQYICQSSSDLSQISNQQSATRAIEFLVLWRLLRAVPSGFNCYVPPPPHLSDLFSSGYECLISPMPLGFSSRVLSAHSARSPFIFIPVIPFLSYFSVIRTLAQSGGEGKTAREREGGGKWVQHMPHSATAERFRSRVLLRALSEEKSPMLRCLTGGGVMVISS
jgi:hypothetical protein